jgi:MFS family permease
LLVPSLIFIALVVAAVGSLGAPLITSVVTQVHVSLAAAQCLVTLAVVVAGSALTVAPLPFAFLLAGRAAQGTGLGLTALMMGVARDHLPAERSRGVIALVSVASTIGIGVGYPLDRRVSARVVRPLGGLGTPPVLGSLVGQRAVLGTRALVVLAAGTPAGKAVPGGRRLHRGGRARRRRDGNHGDHGDRGDPCAAGLAG